MLFFSLQDSALRIFRYIISLTNHFRVRSSLGFPPAKIQQKYFNLTHLAPLETMHFDQKFDQKFEHNSCVTRTINNASRPSLLSISLVQPPIGCCDIINGSKFMIFSFSDKLQLFLTLNSNQNSSSKLLNRPRNGVQSWYARNKKCLKSLIQDAFALVYNVMAGWPPPTQLKGCSCCWSRFVKAI